VDYPFMEIGINGTLFKLYRHPDLYDIPELTLAVTKINYNRKHNLAVPYSEVLSITNEINDMYDSSYYAWNELNEALKKGNKNG
jgi:hypothetical protein